MGYEDFSSCLHVSLHLERHVAFRDDRQTALEHMELDNRWDIQEIARVEIEGGKTGRGQGRDGV
jgi:hypothetical protein